MYKILGSDQKEYGPVSLEELRQWMAQGRVNAQTPVMAEGATEWKPLTAYPELAGPPGLPGAGGQPAAPAKTSGLAIVSLVLGILGFCTFGLAGLVGLVLALVALSQISKSQGRLGGRGLAIGGLCASIVSLLLCIPLMAAMLLPALSSARAQARAVACQSNVKQLELALIMYADSNKSTLPKAANWCDAVMQYVGSPQTFQCQADPDHPRSSYAFNAKLSGVRIDRLSPDTVMLFECQGGWNKSGGAGQMVKRHRRYMVGFVDGSVRQVEEEQLSTLRWEP